MSKCPKCQATLPNGAVACQFCGTVFGTAPPPHVPVGGRPGSGRSVAHNSGQPGWVWPAYYAIAVWWIVDGARAIAAGTVLSGHGGIGGGFGVIGMAIGTATALVGLGLLIRNETARGVVNVLCFLQILDGGLSLLAGFFMTGVLGFWGAIMMIFSAIRIACAGLMIFLIGETDSHAPNF